MFDVNKIREDFPVLKRKIHGQTLVYLDSGATSQKPEVVIEAMNKYYQETNANINRGVYEMSVESTELVEETRKKVAAFIGGRSEEIIFTRNTTESINLVAYTWGEENLHSGEAVVVTKLEHHSNMIPWQELCRKRGAELRVVDVDGKGELVESQEIKRGEKDGLRIRVGGWKEALDEKVVLVAITGQSNVLGYFLYYNLIFILPLIVILLVMTGGKQIVEMKEWEHKNTKWMRLLLGLALLGVGIWIAVN